MIDILTDYVPRKKMEDGQNEILIKWNKHFTGHSDIYLSLDISEKEKKTMRDMNSWIHERMHGDVLDSLADIFVESQIRLESIAKTEYEAIYFYFIQFYTSSCMSEIQEMMMNHVPEELKGWKNGI